MQSLFRVDLRPWLRWPDSYVLLPTDTPIDTATILDKGHWIGPEALAFGSYEQHHQRKNKIILGYNPKDQLFRVAKITPRRVIASRKFRDHAAAKIYFERLAQ